MYEEPNEEQLGKQYAYQLAQMSQASNLVDMLTEDELQKLGQRVCKGYEADECSRAEWKKRSETAMDMALQVTKEKTFPWANAANVKIPFITVSALQFHSRAYPAIVQNSKIVKGKVTGSDQDGTKEAKAERVATHMNYQLLEEMPEWDEQMDALLLALPIEGCEFKKTYYDSIKGRNVSEWVRPDCFVVHYGTKSLEECPRATHVIKDVYPHVITERMRSGIYREVDLGIDSEDDEEEKPQELLEQYRLEDFDEDGVKEPYIVTVHKESQEVLRIRANWEPTGIIVNTDGEIHPAFVQQGAQIVEHEMLMLGDCKLVKVENEQYFTKYSFIPSPDGGFYDIGFGQLIGPLSDAADSIINRLLDAGTLANTSCGLVSKGLRLAGQNQGGGMVGFKAGEFKRVESMSAGSIADNIFQLQFPEPSMVLFNLLGYVGEQITSITAVKDVLTGQGQGQNTPVGTTMALIEQGMKVFTAIYKRIYRALGKELGKIKKLNSIYLPIQTYIRVVDSREPIEVQIQDYQDDGTDVQPVADPNMATTMQRMAKSQFAMQLADSPFINGMEATKMMLESAEMPVDRLLVSEPPQPPPDPKLMETQAKIEKIAAETQEIYTKIFEMSQNMDLKELSETTERMNTIIKAFEAMGPAAVELLGEIDDERGMGAVETPPGDEGVFPGDKIGSGPVLDVPATGPV